MYSFSFSFEREREEIERERQRVCANIPRIFERVMPFYNVIVSISITLTLILKIVSVCLVEQRKLFMMSSQVIF